MGDPKFSRRKWSSPSHPWRPDRIKEEGEIVDFYGLKNHQEIWRLKEILRNWRKQARTLMALKTKQAEVEKKQLIAKISSLGVLPETATLDDVLALNIRNILDRRLQSQVVRKGFAKTAKMARQLISHGHIAVSGQKIDSPGYLISKNEEEKIAFYGKVIGAEIPEKGEK